MLLSFPESEGRWEPTPENGSDSGFNYDRGNPSQWRRELDGNHITTCTIAFELLVLSSPSPPRPVSGLNRWNTSELVNIQVYSGNASSRKESPRPLWRTRGAKQQRSSWRQQQQRCQLQRGAARQRQRLSRQRVDKVATSGGATINRAVEVKGILTNAGSTGIRAAGTNAVSG